MANGRASAKAMCWATATAKLSIVCDFLDQHLELANAHLVQFVIDDLWEKSVPKQIQQSLLPLMDEQWFDFLQEYYYSSTKVVNDDQCSYTFGDASLQQFVRQASKCHPQHLGICTSPEILNLSTSPKEMSLSFDPFASTKKVHEVETIAEIFTALHTNNHLDWVIDIGSGKGYLGSFLALQHGINVLGMDSSTSNTYGAVKRNERLQKSWSGLKRRAEQRREKAFGGREVVGHKSTTPNFTKGTTKHRGKYVCMTRHINEEVHLEDILQEIGIQTSVKAGLVGLHTCGNLAARALDLYVESPPCRVLCNVSCCYHLLEERFASNLDLKLGQKPMEKYGFPLSQFLTNRKFILGRNARMLASEALDRIMAKRTVPSPVLFYRSLLQVILRDKWNNTFEHTHVGRLPSAAGFVNYVQKAFEKLSLSGMMSDNEIEHYLLEHQHQMKQMEAFCRIRSLLAPAIESIILLDRLSYLLEQDNVQEAHLMRAFDPIISPRCFAIISVK